MKNPVLQLQEPHFKYLAAIVASGFYAVQIQAVCLFFFKYLNGYFECYDIQSMQK